MLSYVPKERYLAYIAILLTGLSTLLTAFSYSNIYRYFVEVLLKQNYSLAQAYAIRIAGFLLLAGTIYVVAVLLTHVLAFRLETNLRKKGIEGLIQSGFKYFDENASGLTRKIIDDNAEQTHSIIAHLIPDVAGAVLTPIFALIVGFLVDWRVGLILLATTLIGMFALSGMTGDKTFMKYYQESLEKLSAETVEYVRGIQVIKIFGASLDSFKVLYNAIKEYSQYALQYSMSCKQPWVFFQVMFFALSAILIPFIVLSSGENSGAKEVIDLVMVLFLSGIIFATFMKIMYLSMYSFLGQSVVEKLEKIFNDMQADKLESGVEDSFLNSTIEFEKVQFGYGEELILDGLDLHFEEGKSYALIGPSGGGKSTIAKLISGFYKLQGGQIKIGGKAIQDYSREALMKQIAFVFQDSKLFKSSIWENVKMGNPMASEEEIWEAIKQAGCEEIIAKFPEKEHTQIGAKGVYLSGGEKQRIAIARAFLKNAKIVILDEASAAVDPENEHALQKAFANLMCGKTVIMIAHRLSTVRAVDEILLIQDGKVVERGSDAQLSGRDSMYQHYQNLYNKANDWSIDYE